MNILLTSVGRRSYLVEYFKDALADEGVVHIANSTDFSPAFEVEKNHVVTPLIYDKEYIPFLIDYCKKNSIDAIISLFDIDLLVLAYNKDKFKEIGVELVLSDYEVIEICNDKWNTYLFLQDNGFNVPKTFSDIESALQSIAEGKLNYPVMIKPRWGLGSIGVFEAENELELRVFYDKAKKEISNTYLKYESALDIDNVLIQEKLKGQEYGLDIINDLNCNYQNTVVKMKYAMRAGETDCAVTVSNKSLKMLGKCISGKLRHKANLDVDVFIVDETPYILEINARFGGGYPFTHMAGVNLPKAITYWLKKEKSPKMYLKEEIGVMTHKDIKLVKLSSKNRKQH